MPQELRVALIGQGFMGKAHSNAYHQVHHFFDLPLRLRRQVIVGRNTTALSAIAEKWDWAETATDWRAVVARPDIDVVDVALPNALHAEVAIAAAEAGKMVLCEKPLAITLEQAERMQAAACHVPTLVWFNYRRVPAIRYARQLIDEGRLGEIHHYRASYLQQWGPDRSRDGTWKMDPATAGSGALGDLLSHSIDMALYLNGPIAEVTAHCQNFVPNRAVDDAVLVLARFANGSIGTLEATRFATGCRNQNRFEMHGSGGMLRFQLEKLNHLGFFDARQPSTEQGLRDILVTDLAHPYGKDFWKPGHIIGYEHTFIAALADFVQCVASGEEFHPNFTDGLAVQRVLHAIAQSAHTRGWCAV